MKIVLEVWRQDGPDAPGAFVTYPAEEVHEDASLLETLDTLNDHLIERGDTAITFDHDCREGICGACSMTIDGVPHGPGLRTTTCQIYMRQFPDGATVRLEPFRATTFPVVRDLMVDRSALDRIQQAGGYTGVDAGPMPEPNANPIGQEDAEEAIDAAICIGCGACVAACPNGAAMLFTGAKVTHLAKLPQGQAARYPRVQDMVDQMDAEGFGGCTNFGECEAVCPQGISIRVIGRLNREQLTGVLAHPRNPRGGMLPQ
ncbi:MAG: succinate dehydrogenase / fumarate reductase, iron-sulfur subunit [Solirubrobacteraceae bacterium]|jgi:succinate dehydrogenase / fumarate reductase iron-sulfur subunit|nr:succinate dehydrogenase / fumarate reductase, iron-sulfur subunit [Solirubrobacteraceae bacterium]